MATERELKKGQFVVEQGLAISEFIEKINKLSYKDFPEDGVTEVLLNNGLSLEALDPYIFYSDARYTRNLIYKSQEFELILMCWKPGQHSAIHGHEDQKCWMLVELGSLEFTSYEDKPSLISDLLKKVDVKIGHHGFVDGPAYIHGVRNHSDKDAISLHLYAKPFHECDIYDLHENSVKKIQLGYHSIHGKLVAPEETL